MFIIRKNNPSLILTCISVLSIMLMIIFDKLRIVNLTNLFFVIFVIFSFLTLLINKNNLKSHQSSYILICILMLLCVLSSLISGLSFSMFISGIKYSVFTVSCAWLCLTFYHNLNKLAFIVVVFYIVFSAFILNTVGWSVGNRLAAIFHNTNSLGMILSTGLFFSLYGSIYNNNKKFYCFSLILIGFLCLSTASRTGVFSPLISFVSWYVIFPFLYRNEFKSVNLLNFFKVIFLSIVFILVVDIDIIITLVNNTILSKSGGDITSGRVDYIAEALPLLNYFSAAILPYYIIVDNTFIAFSFDFGFLLALFLFSLIPYSYYLFFNNFRRLNKEVSCFVFISITNYLLYSNLESIRYSPQSALFFFALFYLQYMNYIKKRV